MQRNKQKKIVKLLLEKDYIKCAIILSTVIKLTVTYLLTHDSIGLSEDGPTHEPIEQLAAPRSMRNITVFRQYDKLFEQYGFTVENVVSTAIKVYAK